MTGDPITEPMTQTSRPESVPSKEWKVGDYAYLFPKGKHDTQLSRTPRRITKIDTYPNSDARYAVLKSALEEKDIGVGLEHIFECTEEEFINFAKYFTKMQQDEITKIESRAQQLRQKHLHTLSVLQEFNITL